MRRQILTYLTDHDTLIQPQAMDYILSKKEPIHYVKSILDDVEEPLFILTVEHLKKVEEIGRRAGSSAFKIKTKEMEMKAESKSKSEPIKPKTHFGTEEKSLDSYAMPGVFAKNRVCSGTAGRRKSLSRHNR